MAGQRGQPKYGFGWADGRLGGLRPPGQREARPLEFIKFDFLKKNHKATTDSHAPLREEPSGIPPEKKSDMITKLQRSYQQYVMHSGTT